MTSSSHGASLRATAVVMLASAALHLVVWWCDGSSWAVSFRKPVLFGWSVGLTAWSFDRLLRSLRAPGLARSARAWAGLLTLEVALITVQAWRRVPSHFNTATALDFGIFFVMGAAILGAWAITWWWTALVARQPASPARVTWLGALGLFHLACAFGVFMSVRGTMLAQSGGQHPELMGEAGSVHLPHALALHALQTLPALGWVLSWRGVSASRQVPLLRLAMWAHVALVAWAVAQMAAGAAPFSLGAPAVLLLLALGLGAPSLIAVVVPFTLHLRRSP
jgi:hypothetical protein